MKIQTQLKVPLTKNLLCKFDVIKLIIKPYLRSIQNLLRFNKNVNFS